MLEQFYIEFQSYLFHYERIPYAVMAILIAMFIGVITGPLAGNANPFFWQLVDIFFGGFGEKLDRRHRGRGTLVFRGLLLTVFVLAIAFYAARGAEYLVARFPLAGFSEGLVLVFFITAGAVWFALARLYGALEKKNVGQGAYYAISRSTRANLSSVDDFGITRTGMNFAAFSFDKGMVAPVLWYLIGGLPALFLYASLAALAWRFGKSGFTKGFGEFPLMLEKLLGIIPSLLAAILLTLASLFTPKAKLHKGIASWLTFKGRSPYTQGGFPLTALAWALNLSLGGPEQDVSGSAIQSNWVGPANASAKIDPKRLRQGIYIHVIAHLLFIASLLGAYLWARGGLPHLLAMLPF